MRQVCLFNVDIDAVQFHAVLGTDQDVFLAVYDAGLHQIAPVGSYLDDHVGGAHLQLLGGHHIDGGDLTVQPQCILKLMAELLHPLGGYAAALHGVGKVAHGDFRGLGVLFQLLLFSICCRR